MIGRFTEYLTLQQSVRVSDGAFGYTESWQTVANIWASVLPEEEVYGIQNNQPVSTNRYVIETHYLSDLTGVANTVKPIYRLLWGSDQLLIEGVSTVNQRYMMIRMIATLIQGEYEAAETNNAFPYTFPLTLA